MKRQTPIQIQKENMPPQMRGHLSHAAVRATVEHDIPSNVSAETRFGHDFSQVSVRPLPPIIGQNYLNTSCPLSPQRCPFGGACHTCPPRVQAKLKIGQPGDKYEQEADRVADQVMRMPEPQLSCSVGNSSLANGTIPRGGTIQRVCVSCSEEYKTADAENRTVEPINLCPKYRTRKKGLIQTKQITPLIQRQETLGEEEDEDLIQTQIADDVTPEVTPTISVGIQSLQDGGRQLSGSERSFFEPRFGADFSNVRVHSDARAASIARSVNARAFTFGHNVVFGAAEYSSDTLSGRKLFAHELTHVVQQDGDLDLDHKTYPSPVSLSAFPPKLIQREEIEVELVPSTPEERERLREQGIELPTVSRDTWRLIGGVANHAGATLTRGELDRIRQMLQRNGVSIPSGGTQTVSGMPQFVLHDTAGLISGARIAEHARQGRGPLGLGIAAWVPQSGAATISRPRFFETQRPSASEYEKSRDIIGQAPREAAVRQVWQACNSAAQDAALISALNGLGLTQTEITSESRSARTQLNARSGMVYTTAHWAVRELCRRANNRETSVIARSSATVNDVTTGCRTLAPYLAARPMRIGSAVNIELVQAAGSHCATTGHLVRLAPYTATQYNNAVLLYLRAAYMAGRYPETTTHFWVDRSFRGHCDPRCFNLQHFYDLIAGAMGHGIGSTYGPTANYGTTWGTHNVWWQDTVCGGSHP